jgi:hypothetical protein
LDIKSLQLQPAVYFIDVSTLRHHQILKFIKQ